MNKSGVTKEQDYKINWKKVTKNKEAITLIKAIEVLEDRVRELDATAMLNYRLEVFKSDTNE